MSPTLEIKRALAELGEATIRQIATLLDIPEADYAGREKLRFAMRDLVDIGLVVRTLHPGDSDAVYRLSGKTSVRGETQEKIWRAILVKRLGFTVKDLAVLSGASREYIKRYLHFLRAQGFVEEAGRKKLSRFGVGLVYRLAPGREKEAAPRYNRRKEMRQGRRQTAAAAQGLVRQTMNDLENSVSLVATYAVAAVALVKEMAREMETLIGGTKSEAGDGDQDIDQT